MSGITGKGTNKGEKTRIAGKGSRGDAKKADSHSHRSPHPSLNVSGTPKSPSVQPSPQDRQEPKDVEDKKSSNEISSSPKLPEEIFSKVKIELDSLLQETDNLNLYQDFITKQYISNNKGSNENSLINTIVEKVNGAEKGRQEVQAALNQSGYGIDVYPHLNLIAEKWTEGKSLQDIAREVFENHVIMMTDLQNNLSQNIQPNLEKKWKEDKKQRIQDLTNKLQNIPKKDPERYQVIQQNNRIREQISDLNTSTFPPIFASDYTNYVYKRLREVPTLSMERLAKEIENLQTRINEVQQNLKKMGYGDLKAPKFLSTDAYEKSNADEIAKDIVENHLKLPTETTTQLGAELEGVGDFKLKGDGNSKKVIQWLRENPTTWLFQSEMEYEGKRVPVFSMRMEKVQENGFNGELQIEPLPAKDLANSEFLKALSMHMQEAITEYNRNRTNNLGAVANSNEKWQVNPALAPLLGEGEKTVQISGSKQINFNDFVQANTQVSLTLPVSRFAQLDQETRNSFLPRYSNFKQKTSQEFLKFIAETNQEGKKNLDIQHAGSGKNQMQAVFKTPPKKALTNLVQSVEEQDEVPTLQSNYLRNLKQGAIYPGRRPDESVETDLLIVTKNPAPPFLEIQENEYGQRIVTDVRVLVENRGVKGAKVPIRDNYHQLMMSLMNGQAVNTSEEKSKFFGKLASSFDPPPVDLPPVPRTESPTSAPDQRKSQPSFARAPLSTLIDQDDL
ncbi:MAG: hypothetical protein F6K18_26020 [Okeania sp. SIO2C2]|uniref:hypothetical protein n=1 Tax=Okeania sp. SIO2C2 TaxID=2607787 RepID=UPI0013BC3293|nr:hypothetical protein [Okeania sp. SIO2C2]NEP90000.1 hypothetical protein [Okeania sp. SIO2C2]